MTQTAKDDEAMDNPSGQTANAIEYRFQFTGSGSEYFRIWIVNLLFSLLTLGIYSAWAKVRREQYFHRNTLLDGSGFDYHGNPIAILKGRAVAVALLVLLSWVDHMESDLYYPLLLALSPFVPWLMIRSFVFRSRNTSYRGLRFGFHGTYKEFCKLFLLPYLIQIVCAWQMVIAAESFEGPEAPEGTGNLLLLAAAFMVILLLVPVLLHRFKSFQFNHLVFGASRFRNDLRLTSFFGLFLRVGLVSLALVFALALVGGAIAVFASISRSGQVPEWMFVLLLLIPLAYIPLIVVPSAYFTAHLTNLVWNGACLDEHRFRSDQTFGGISKLAVLNWLFIVLTLGFYWPWARVRLARYRAEHTAMLAAGGLDGFIGGAAQEQNAYGEEIADAFDFDVGF